MVSVGHFFRSREINFFYFSRIFFLPLLCVCHPCTLWFSLLPEEAFFLTCTIKPQHHHHHLPSISSLPGSHHHHRSSRLLLLGCSWSESTLLSNCQRLVSPSPPSISLRFLWSSSAPFLLSPWSFLSTNTTISFLSQQAISSNTIISSFRSPVLYLFFLCHRPASPVTSPSLLSLLKLLYCRADHLCCLGKTPVRLSSSLFTGEFISSSFEFQCLLWVGLVRFIY